MIHAVALFSGGLDSILAAKVVMEQGLSVRCLHFVTPFFGKPHMLEHWSQVYGVDLEATDVGEAYVHMLRQRPVYGFGKIMNPCVDCKILMMQHARRRMEELGASFIISGEVLGQRPMSQRRDALNVIRRDGEVRDILLRPLCAKHLDPTEPELSGLVDRERLYSIFGRGRKDQIALAAALGIMEIPSPAGGCRLAEKENARRYWPVLTRLSEPVPADFALSNVGRQGWSANLWLSMGRNEADNLSLSQLALPGDYFIKTLDFPGPLALARPVGDPDAATLQAELRSAAAYVASCAPKAVRAGGEVDVRLTCNNVNTVVRVLPERNNAGRSDVFIEPEFDEVKDVIRAEAREVAEAQKLEREFRQQEYLRGNV